MTKSGDTVEGLILLNCMPKKQNELVPGREEGSYY